MMTAGYSGLARDFEKNGCRDYLMDSFGDLTGAKAATGGRFVIGCFENAAGRRRHTTSSTWTIRRKEP